MLPTSIRQFSQRAINNPKSKEAVVLYGYIVAATVLPFAGPALKGGEGKQSSGPKSNPSLHYGIH